MRGYDRIRAAGQSEDFVVLYVVLLVIWVLAVGAWNSVMFSSAIMLRDYFSKATSPYQETSARWRTVPEITQKDSLALWDI